MDGGTGDPLGSRSTVKIFANIFISFIGAGVLGLPFAFKEVMPTIVIISVIYNIWHCECDWSSLSVFTTMSQARGT